MWGEMHQTPNHPSCTGGRLCCGHVWFPKTFAGLMGYSVNQKVLSSRTVSTADLGDIHTPDEVPKREMSLHAGHETSSAQHCLPEET